MRSALRFVMHPEDEANIIAELLHDPSVLLIDKARWLSVTPPTSRSLADIGYYCNIWSPNDLQELTAESQFATIQFLRSSIAGAVLMEGRFAVSTDPHNERSAAGVEKRFRLLSRIVKRSFANGVLRWFSKALTTVVEPESPARSPNPSKPDTSLWVGPAAMKWLASDPARRVKHGIKSRSKATLCR
jgi:hypothetical protein